MRLVIVGGGFAGVWAALAARERRPRDRTLEIMLVSRDSWLTIRPRLYERSLDGVRVPLDSIFANSGVRRVIGDVTHIDWAARRLTVRSDTGTRVLQYDRLVLAAGSALSRPSIPGIELAFTVDTYTDAEALHRQLLHVGSRSAVETRDAVVVVGAGFTGLEVATELASRIRSEMAGGRDVVRRVVLVDSAEVVGHALTSDARRHVEAALRSLDIELRLGRRVRTIERDGVTLSDGQHIRAATTIWTGGFRANTLARALPVTHDDLGRIPVDEFLRVKGVPAIYAAGDVARTMVDGSHVAPMSCQYAIPTGMLAGANAVCDLYGLPRASFSSAPYVTCLDLGDAGAVFTEGFDDHRRVKLTGYWAKRMKETINGRLIYPPLASTTAVIAEADHRPSAA